MRLVQSAAAHESSSLRALVPLLLGALSLGTGCDDAEVLPSDVESRDYGFDLPAEPEPLAQDQADIPEHAGPKVIPDHYLVLMERNANPHAAAAAVGAKPNHVYTSVMSGFAGQLNAKQVAALEKRKDVLYIEADQVVTATQVCPAQHPKPVTQYKADGMPYGIDRCDQRNLPLSGSYTYSWAGNGVNVYVFDTGIETSHPDFEGRAKATYDAFNDGRNGQDCHGHGTHVAGIIGGKKYGVAKKATLHSVRVLGCDGHGTWSKLIAAMDWVMDNAPKPAVANMSLAGGWSLVVNIGVNNLVNSGVTVVVAAGNESDDACWYSPAAASQALTVAASNSNDQWASFSNHGTCVDIIAPGTNIRSAWLNGGNTTATGTSMASPHVAGVAALYLHAFKGKIGATGQVQADILSWASKNKISGVPDETDNLLVHWPCSGL
jgi:subtilisin family serine protease